MQQAAPSRGIFALPDKPWSASGGADPYAPGAPHLFRIPDRVMQQAQRDVRVGQVGSQADDLHRRQGRPHGLVMRWGQVARQTCGLAPHRHGEMSSAGPDQGVLAAGQRTVQLAAVSRPPQSLPGSAPCRTAQALPPPAGCQQARAAPPPQAGGPPPGWARLHELGDGLVVPARGVQHVGLAQPGGHLLGQLAPPLALGRRLLPVFFCFF